MQENFCWFLPEGICQQILQRQLPLQRQRMLCRVRPNGPSLERGVGGQAGRKVAPVVAALPTYQTKPTVTNDERLVAVCPATVRDDVNCSTCGICVNPRRRAIVGFPAHGSGAKKVQKVFMLKQERV